MVTVVAPTTPLAAASSRPTNSTAIPRPPRQLPSSRASDSSRSSATRDRSSMTPMKMKSGIAISVSLAMMPKMRDGSAFRQRNGEEAEHVGDQRDRERDAAERQRGRITGQQRAADQYDQQDGEPFDPAHGVTERSASPDDNASAARAACAIPCSSISAANNGIDDLSRNTRGMPPASREPSMIAHARRA